MPHVLDLHPRFAALGLVLLVAACAGRQQTIGPIDRQLPGGLDELPLEEQAPPQAAILLPLSGSAAAVGNDMLDAAQMALFDVGRTDLVLLPQDTQGTPEGARAAARAAIAADVDVVLGPLFSSSTKAVAPLAAGADIPVLAFTNDADVAGGGTWILGYRPEEQVERVVAHARERGMTPVGAIAPDDVYGARALDAWRAGGAAGGAQTYDPRETDLARIVRDALRGGPPRALLIADGGERLRSIGALLTYYDFDPTQTRLLGTMLWLEDRSLLREPALNGAWLATVPPRDDDAFAERFERLYGRSPNVLAGLAYDATALAAVLANDGQGFAAPQLADAAGFAGHAGIFRLMPNGLSEHGLAVVEVGQDGVLDVVAPAPSSFERPLAALQVR